MYHLGDTIAAIASPPGGAGRAIVRSSGPRAREVLGALFQSDDARSLDPITAPTRVSGSVATPPAAAGSEAHEPLRIPVDLFFWPGARSYTREPLAELHLFGAEPLVAAVLRAAIAAARERPSRASLRSGRFWPEGSTSPRPKRCSA